MWPAIAGAAIGAFGSAFGGGSSAPKYRPWDINMPGVGSATFDRKNKTATGSMDPRAMAMMEQLYGGAMAPGYGQGMAQFGQGMVGMMPGLFGDAQAASFLDPAMAGQFNQNMDAAMRGNQRATGQMFNFGQNMMNGQGPGMGQARRMFGAGMGMLGERPGQSYQDVAQGRVDLLRQQAAPYENRAQNALFQKLQGMGQMGMPSSQRGIEAFATGLGQADLSRQMEGQNLAESLYGRDLNYSLGRNQIGAGMAGQGMSGMFQGIGQGINAFGMGMQGLNDRANMGQMQYQGNMQFADATNARAQQRMGNATNMFGFGQDAQSRDLQAALAQMGGFQNFQSGAMDALKLGASMGSQNAAAAGQYGPQANPWGQLAQGVGYGMMNGAFGGMGGYQQQPIYPGGGVPMVNQPNSPIRI